MKDFATFGIATELKKLDFNEPCLAVYRGGDLYGTGTSVSRFYGDGDWELVKNSDYDKDSFNWVAAPLYSQVFQWARQEYALESHIEPIEGSIDVPKTYRFVIGGELDDVWHDTYEEAEIELAKKLIEIMKTQYE
jgi:hypothetical protein